MSELSVPPSADFEASGDGSDDAVEWRDPVSVTFAGHGGRVVDIACSPFHRDVFASAGSDAEIRVYSLLQPHAPTHVLHQEQSLGGIAALRWSPARPTVLAAAAMAGVLQVFDLKSDRAGFAPLELRAADNKSQRGGSDLALTSAAINAKNRSLICGGDGLGRAHVWRLTEALFSAGPAEVRMLEEFLHTEDDEDDGGGGDEENERDDAG